MRKTSSSRIRAQRGAGRVGKTAPDRALTALPSRQTPWNNAHLVAAHEAFASARRSCTAIAKVSVLSFASTNAPITQTEA